MTIPAASSSCSSQECTLASCAVISHRIQAALANDSVLILHRSQWQCLAKSFSEVLQFLADHQLLQHACPLLRSLLHCMQEAERCIEDCTARRHTFSHSWLLDKALKLGASSDVVNFHLRDFLWSFSTVLNQAMAPPIDTVESDFVQLTQALSDIWACEDANADLSEACNFLNTIKAEEEGETSLLADFILHKLSYAQDLESGELGVVPAYLWIDPGSLKRSPEMLCQGGYAQVYEAGWLGGHFAVKDFFYVENNTLFGREAAIQARLRHPNVVSLVCCAKNPSRHKCSLVMELMQQDLRVLMIEKIGGGMDPPFSLGVAVDLMLQIAQGLEYLHSLHIMHRDLKSSNVLVSFSRRKCDVDMDDVDMDDVDPCVHLKIADFGMSKAKHASSKFTTRQVGTTSWRAPEVFEINPEDEVEEDTDGKYTKKADVYSFALVCYEILTGKSPFEGPRVRKRVLSGERPVLPPYCPPALSSYIERCWHAKPSRRPPFSQICRMLRYFKACIFLQDHNRSPTHHSWLLRPLSRDVCARIDDMVISFVQSTDTSLQSQPVNIPLEMHCCRMVLEGRDESNMYSQNFSSTDSSSEEDDPLPAIEGLCVDGDAILGSKILALGNSINGTVLCYFQWVRQHRDGSFFCIPGAAKPDYTITADDVDTRLSLECTPLDDRNRKGEMVRVFVNNNNWIDLEAAMKDLILEYLESGHAIFEVKLVFENAQDPSFEPAILSLKRSMYELKRVNGKQIVGSETYASESEVEIQVREDSHQCAIINNTGVMHLLHCRDKWTRDLLVLTMRKFIKEICKS